ncbi:hypothetical protein NMY22_g19410 [Coprinellus aureogranulatus]|nr:hypothetical protein NMY22_g19410 [Coprinellus aureogranulatus]
MADFKFNSLSPFALLLTPVSLSLFHIHAMAMEDASSAAHGFQMPHVFVVPPEEDETPTWCCFDAALPIDKQIQQRDDFDPNDESFDSSIAYDEEIAAVDAAMARRNMGTRSIVDTLMSKDFNIEHAALDSDSDLEWDSENEYQPQDRHNDSQPPSPSADSFSEAGNDSLVVEVMKVGRRKRYTFEGDDQQMGPRRPSTMKQSGTFTARASQAFRQCSAAVLIKYELDETARGAWHRKRAAFSA